MNEIINPAIPLKKVNRKFSLEDKKVLYQQWKMSNQTKHAFCKAQRFTKTSFYKWCQKLEGEEKIEKINRPNHSGAFAPVIHRKKILVEKGLEAPEKISLELLLPNQIMIKLQLPLNQVNHLIQEWCDAATIVR